MISYVFRCAILGSRAMNRPGVCWRLLMRNGGAEWGYTGFGREPGRAASLIFVACAVGAVAGASAVFSLVAQPGSETSIGSAHPLGSVVVRAAAHSPVKEAALPSRPRLAWTVSGRKTNFHRTSR